MYYHLYPEYTIKAHQNWAMTIRTFKNEYSYITLQVDEVYLYIHLVQKKNNICSSIFKYVYK
jgi:hypothetical protein